MTKIDRFFLFYLVIFYVELSVQMMIIRDSIDLQKEARNSHNNIYFISLCFSLLSFLEFYSISKFCFLLQLEGIVQFIPLKICHYFFVLKALCHFETRLFAVAYMLCDAMFLVVFLFMKDESFSNVYHEYNIKIGMDVNVRNAFIVSRNLI